MDYQRRCQTEDMSINDSDIASIQSCIRAARQELSTINSLTATQVLTALSNHPLPKQFEQMQWVSFNCFISMG